MKGKFVIKPLHGRYILFQIIEMDERFRGLSGKPLYHSCNGWTIYSNRIPDLDIVEKTIGLPGLWKKHDNEPIIDHCPEDQPPISTIIAEIKLALKDWAENWYGWEEPPKEQPDEKDIFVV